MTKRGTQGMHINFPTTYYVACNEHGELGIVVKQTGKKGKSMYTGIGLTGEPWFSQKPTWVKHKDVLKYMNDLLTKEAVDV